MRAEFQTYRVKATKETIKDRADVLREQAKYDHGHSDYTGTIAEDNGWTKLAPDVMSLSEAEDYIHKTARKWGHSVAVPLNAELTDWLVGGFYSS